MSQNAIDVIKHVRALGIIDTKLTDLLNALEEESRYNGWTNYETWCVNLWLSNDQGSYESVNDLIRSQVGSGLGGVEDVLKGLVEELTDATHPGLTDGASFVTDLYNGALSEVNWQEIIKNWVSGMDDIEVTLNGEIVEVVNESTE